MTNTEFKEFLEASGVSVNSIAEVLHVTRNYISAQLSGQARLQPKTVAEGHRLAGQKATEVRLLRFAANKLRTILTNENIYVGLPRGRKLVGAIHLLEQLADRHLERRSGRPLVKKSTGGTKNRGANHASNSGDRNQCLL